MRITIDIDEAGVRVTDEPTFEGYFPEMVGPAEPDAEFEDFDDAPEPPSFARAYEQGVRDTIACVRRALGSPIVRGLDTDDLSDACYASDINTVLEACAGDIEDYSFPFVHGMVPPGGLRLEDES